MSLGTSAPTRHLRPICSVIRCQEVSKLASVLLVKPHFNAQLSLCDARATSPKNGVMWENRRFAADGWGTTPARKTVQRSIKIGYP